MFISYTDEDPFEHSFLTGVKGLPHGDGALWAKFIRYEEIKRAEAYIKKNYATSNEEKLYMKLFDKDGNLIGYSTADQFDYARNEFLQVIPAPPGWWVVSPDFPDGLGAAPLIGWRNSAPVFAGPDLSKRHKYPYASDIAVLVDPEGHVFSYRKGHMISELPEGFPKINSNDVLPEVVRAAIEKMQIKPSRY